MDNNIWAVDQIENTTAIIENITTKEKKEVNIQLLPQNIKEGSLISYKNKTYKLELTQEKQRRIDILEKFQKLRDNQNRP